jgi:uncharacterized iron-regulated protein
VSRRSCAAQRAAARHAGARAGTLLAAALLASCGVAPTTKPPHPLTGQILRSADGARLSPDDLFAAAGDADVVLLGETHDNEHHHALQLRMLRELIGRGRRPALGLEMVDTTQSATLMRYVVSAQSKHAAADPDATLRRALGWSHDDWRWTAYGPLLAEARAQGLVVFGADLPVSLRRRMASTARTDLTGAERALVPDAPPAEQRYAALTRERIREAHCGHGSDEYLDRLLEVWTARNETMARAVVAALDASDGQPVVLVVGRGHLRNDRGVPQRVRRLRPQATVLSLGLRETQPSRTALSDYTAPPEDAGTLGPDYPYLWLTPGATATAPDPCAVFRHRHG